MSRYNKIMRHSCTEACITVAIFQEENRALSLKEELLSSREISANGVDAFSSAFGPDGLAPRQDS